MALNAGTRKVNVSVATGAAGLPWCCAFLGCGTWLTSMVSVAAADAGLLSKASTHGDSRQEKKTETQGLGPGQSFLVVVELVPGPTPF